MKPIVFKGSAVALVTPMREDGSVNQQVLEELLIFHLTHHTDAIVVAGTTGESATLSDEEHLQLIQFCVEKIDGRLPVIAGVGSNNTAHAVHLSKEAERLGADALAKSEQVRANLLRMISHDLRTFWKRQQFAG